MSKSEKKKLIMDVKKLEKQLGRRPTKHDNSALYSNCLNKKFNMSIGNKSLTARVPRIINSSNKNIASFIGGVIDGDDHITQGTVHISSGYYLFLMDIKMLLSKLFIKCKSKIEKRKTCYVLNLNKHESSIIYDKCYDKATYFYPRKKHKILKTNILKNINCD